MLTRRALLAVPGLLVATLPFDLQRDSGSLEGNVVDQFGPVPCATITARNTVSGDTAHAKSDRAGRYCFDALHRGTYSLWAEAAEHDSIWILHVAIERGVVKQQDV